MTSSAMDAGTFAGEKIVCFGGAGLKIGWTVCLGTLPGGSSLTVGVSDYESFAERLELFAKRAAVGLRGILG